MAKAAATKAKAPKAPVEAAAPAPKAPKAKKESAVVTGDSDSSKLIKVARYFDVVRDMNRVKALLLLESNPDGVNVTDICAHLGMTQPAVSHHLALLRYGDVVEARRDGKNNFYHLTTVGEMLVGWVHQAISVA